MKKILLSSFLCLIVSNYVLSVDSTIFNYYPLNIGNSWTYNRTSNFQANYKYKKTIIDTIRMNSHLYYKFVNSVDTSKDYIRIDSVTGNLLRYNSAGCNWLQNEELIDSLNAKKNDGFASNCGTGFCLDTNYITLFNIITQSKAFHNAIYVTRRYAKVFGYYLYLFEINFHYYLYTSDFLLGCIIGGTLYGDTALPTGIKPTANLIPEEFQLFQNYPNPFNPLTKIKFDVPKTSFVKLVVYDLLGREVSVPINEQLKPGTYEAEWNGDNLPSGVYFYKLATDDFIQTKKMVLLK